MANDSNLIPNLERTPEKRRENAAKAGVASGKKRRENKAMRETLDILLSMPLENGKTAEIEKVKSIAAMNGANITVQEAIMMAQIKRALNGDTKAAEFIRDSAGQKPTLNVESKVEASNPYAGLTTEELKKLIEHD